MRYDEAIQTKEAYTMPQQTIHPLYAAIAHTQLQPNRDTYQFAHQMLKKIRKLLHGKQSKLYAVQLLLEALHADAPYYEQFFEDMLQPRKDVFPGKAQLSLPISCLNTMDCTQWNRNNVDRTRKNFDALETKLRHTLEGKHGLTFTATPLTLALYCFADFYTLVHKMIENKTFLADITKKEFAPAHAEYIEKLAQLSEEFLTGLQELATCKKDETELKIMENVQVVTVEELFDIVLGSLSWNVSDGLDYEEFMAHFEETNLFITSSPVQALTLKINALDDGGVVFFQTVTGEFYLISLHSEDGFLMGELQVMGFNSKQAFLIELTNLLNDWNPDFNYESPEMEFSTRDDVTHAIHMILR